jgi:hypothetical protein
MGANTAPERPQLAAGAVGLGSVSFVGALDSGELLTGTPTVTEVDTDDAAVAPATLTIENVAVNVAALTINNKSVAIGQAVQFKVSGQAAGNSYRLRIVVATTSSPAQTERKWVHFDGVNE